MHTTSGHPIRTVIVCLALMAVTLAKLIPHGIARLARRAERAFFGD